jgi:UPF0755 protein
MLLNFKKIIFSLFEKTKAKIGLIIFLLFLAFFIYFLNIVFSSYEIGSKEVFFEIQSGQSFFEIVKNLDNQKLIKSKNAFIIWGFLTGDFLRIKSATHKISYPNSIFGIFKNLTSVENTYTKVTIPEGSNLYEIDEILSLNNVLKSGELINFVKENQLNIEGKLMPDTYIFFYNSKPNEIIKKMNDNFNQKILPLLEKSNNPTSTLILASLIEKESPFLEDKKIIAGILLKRLKANMPLQVDASICYIKDLIKNKAVPCLPLNSLDFKINLPYNTYTNKGLPPTPISNPGKESILAVIEPKESNYWYYLNDPKTKKAIFSKTFEEHKKNIFIYLRSND